MPQRIIIAILLRPHALHPVTTPTPTGRLSAAFPVVSVLSPSDDLALDFDNLNLKRNFSPRKAARHAITMTHFTFRKVRGGEPDRFVCALLP